MASAAQITANQANAQLSTGPVTAQGKARTAQNARRHGLTARTPHISEEDRAEFAALEARLLRETHPKSCLEEEVFHRILAHTWNLRRIESFESAILAETDPIDFSETDAARLNHFARYRRDLERSLYRAMNELRKLQTDRALLQLQSPFAIHSLTEAAPMAEVSKLQPRLSECFVGHHAEQVLAQTRFTSGPKTAIKFSKSWTDAWLKVAGKERLAAEAAV
ncbi:hypothetical protein [Paludibaculum fermentans]|uniref:Uncharacterized protein n=1 Tax=Paludibaculum fermentans TaxID=1473598 RepID=A0A7S7SKX2_PALFE|nr:hypothetical protein [Paludibaculum fermentans]QOY87861.1 hypothetical protein IRI77_34850 [Paludibaculum fermentans]